MPDPTSPSRDAFARQVFPAELEEVARRQSQMLGEVRPELARLAGKAPEPDAEAADGDGGLTGFLRDKAGWLINAVRSEDDEPEAGRRRTHFHGVRPSSELGLVGLALSGGGIRSATFNLGFLQSLAERGVFPLVDYLSTVSGGGYLGSCLSSMLANPDRHEFPLGMTENGTDSPALRHLRNSGNFLASGLVDFVRIPALLLRGILLHVLLLLPYLTVAVWMTWFLCGKTLVEAAREESWTGFWKLTAYMAAALAGYILISPLVKLLLRRAPLTRRNAYERSFGYLLLGVLVVGLAQLLPTALSFAHHFFRQEGSTASFEGVQERWWFALGTTLLSALFAALGSSTRSALARGLALAGLGLVAPFIFLALYLAFGEWCVFGNGPLASLPPWLPADPLSFLDLSFLDSKMPEEVKTSGWWLFTFVVAFLAVYTWLLVDVNTTSMHGFYRDRLSRAYLLGYSEDRQKLEHNDAQRLSELGTAAPYHILNAALNLQALKDPDLRDRKADFFFFSRRFVGGELTGYCPTREMEKADRRLDLGTAMAISAAAAAPNMGQATSPSLVLLMALFNVRLGYWLPNPQRIAEGFLFRRGIRALRGVGPIFLLFELMSAISNKSAFVNLTDGGHIENLGLYELLRRRVKLIIACDAEEDVDLAFGSLANVMRFAKIDLGVEIELELDEIRKGESGLSRDHCALGKVRYPPTEGEPKGGVGYLLYVKSSVVGDEPETIREYRARHPSFPHESTGDQFFDEAQFESYRSLGYGIAESLFEGTVRQVDGQPETLEAWFRGLESMLRPDPKDDEDAFVGLQEQLTAVESALKEPELAAYAHQIYPEIPPSLPSSVVPSPEDKRVVFHFVNSQLQLMENVFTALDLDRPKKRHHHLNRGWMNLFKRWSQAPYFRWAWAISIGTYNVSFQDFCEDVLELGTKFHVVPGDWNDLTASEKRELAAWGLATADGLSDPRDHIWLAGMGVESATAATPRTDTTSFTFGFCLLHFEQAEDGLEIAFRFGTTRSFYRGMGLFERMLEKIRQSLRAKFPAARTNSQITLRRLRQVSKLIYLLDRHGFPLEDDAFVRLYDKDPRVRRDAALELAGLAAQPNVRDALLDRLRSATTTEVRVALVKSLASATDHPDVRRALLTRLADDNEEVMAAAAEALAKGSSDSEIREILLERLEEQSKRLEEPTEGSTEPLEQQLADTIQALGTGSWDVTDRLLPFLREDRLKLRKAAAQALTHATHDDQVLAAFRALLAKENDLRPIAVHALGKRVHDDESIRESILAILADTKADLSSRKEAARCLRWAPHEREIRKVLFRRLGDEGDKPEIRVAAAEALVRSGDPDARDGLKWHLQEPRRLVRDAAREAVGRAAADPEAGATLLRLANDGPTKHLVLALAPAVRSDEVRDFLLERLNDDDLEIRLAAIEALDDATANEEVRATLLGYLGHPELRVREAAIRSLRCDACHPEVWNALVALLEARCEDEGVRRAAVGTLAEMAFWPPVRDALLRHLVDGSPLCQEVARVLGRGGYPPEVLSKLLGLFKRNKGVLRNAAARALAGALHQDEVEEALLGDDLAEIKEIDPALRATAAERPEILATLLARLSKRRQKGRQRVVTALAGCVGYDQVRGALLTVLKDKTEQPATRVAAATALTDAAEQREVRDAFLAHLDTKEPSLRRGVLKALGPAVGQRKVRDDLLARLSQTDPAERLEVALTLAGQVHRPEVLDALISELHSSDLERRQTVARALQDIAVRRDRRDVCDALLVRLADPDMRNRHGAAIALAAAWSDPEVRSALTACLDDPNPRVRDAASIAAPADVRRPRPSVEAEGAFERGPQDDVDLARLRERLGEGDEASRCRVVQALLPATDRKEVQDALLALVDGDLESLRRTAIRVLAEGAPDVLLGHLDESELTEGKPALEALAAAVRRRSVDESTVRRVWDGLRQKLTHRPGSREACEALLEPPDRGPAVPLARLRSLAPVAHFPEVRDALFELLEEDGEPAQEAAVFVLGKAAGDDDVRRGLVERLSPERELGVRRAAALALAGVVLLPEVRDALFTHLNDDEPAMQTAVTEALGAAFGVPEVAEALLYRLDDPQLAEAVVRGLGRAVSLSEARQELLRLAQEPGPLRDAALRALAPAVYLDEVRAVLPVAAAPADAADVAEDEHEKRIARALLACLKSDQEDLRRGAARALAVDEPLRYASARSLASLVDRPPVERELCARLRHEYMAFAGEPLAVCQALAGAAHREAVRDALLDRFEKTERNDLRLAAAHALAGVAGDPKVESAFRVRLEGDVDDETKRVLTAVLEAIEEGTHATRDSNEPPDAA